MASPTQPQQPHKPLPESSNSPPLLPNPTPPSSIAAIPTTHQFNYPSFSQLLEGVVKAATNSASSSSSSLQNVSFKGQFGMSHQEALASVTAKAAQGQFTAGFANPTLDASLVKKPELSVIVASDIGLVAKPLPLTNDSMRGRDKKSLSNQINKPVSDIAKTPNSDGYNWRKYGQKQVKSSESFRSYYRCTNSGCQTKKKVLHADKSGCIVGVDYKGEHNHDPPTKAIKEKSLKTRTADGGPVFKTNSDSLSAKKQFGDSHVSVSGKVNEQVMSVDDKSEPEKSNKCHDTTSMDVEEQHDKKPNVVQRVIVQQPTLLPEEPSRSIETNEYTMTEVRNETNAPSGQKRRMKDRARAYSEQLQKAPKQTKIVVHADGDVGISTDGYRWRKYGQKTVKGNSHPRSYYRCTSAGCAARKHVEKATDNSTAMTVTYEGKHDHDKPVPKKHQTNGNSPAEKPVEGKGTDKVIESARTLLSIGIELKSC